MGSATCTPPPTGRQRAIAHVHSLHDQLAVLRHGSLKGYSCDADGAFVAEALRTVEELQARTDRVHNAALGWRQKLDQALAEAETASPQLGASFGRRSLESSLAAAVSSSDVILSDGAADAQTAGAYHFHRKACTSPPDPTRGKLLREGLVLLWAERLALRLQGAWRRCQHKQQLRSQFRTLHAYANARCLRRLSQVAQTSGAQVSAERALRLAKEQQLARTTAKAEEMQAEMALLLEHRAIKRRVEEARASPAAASLAIIAEAEESAAELRRALDQAEARVRSTAVAAAKAMAESKQRLDESAAMHAAEMARLRRAEAEAEAGRQEAEAEKEAANAEREAALAEKSTTLELLRDSEAEASDTALALQRLTAHAMQLSAALEAAQARVRHAERGAELVRDKHAREAERARADQASALQRAAEAHALDAAEAVRATAAEWARTLEGFAEAQQTREVELRAAWADEAAAAMDSVRAEADAKKAAVEAAAKKAVEAEKQVAARVVADARAQAHADVESAVRAAEAAEAAAAQAQMEAAAAAAEHEGQLRAAVVAAVEARAQHEVKALAAGEEAHRREMAAAVERARDECTAAHAAEMSAVQSEHTRQIEAAMAASAADARMLLQAEHDAMLQNMLQVLTPPPENPPGVPLRTARLPEKFVHFYHVLTQVVFVPLLRSTSLSRKNGMAIRSSLGSGSHTRLHAYLYRKSKDGHLYRVAAHVAQLIFRKHGCAVSIAARREHSCAPVGGADAPASAPAVLRRANLPRNDEVRRLRHFEMAPYASSLSA
eukprot:2993893-Pleurochrysis_carterae.AAC.3